MLLHNHFSEMVRWVRESGLPVKRMLSQLRLMSAGWRNKVGLDKVSDRIVVQSAVGALTLLTICSSVAPRVIVAQLPSPHGALGRPHMHCELQPETPRITS